MKKAPKIAAGTIVLACGSPICLAAAPSSQPSGANPPFVTLDALRDVKISFPGGAAAPMPSIIGLPLISPPIGGTSPQVVFTLTNKQANDFLTFTDNGTISGTIMPTNSSSKAFFPAILDSGAQSHYVTYDQIQTFNLLAASREGGATASIQGAGDGSPTDADVSDGLGVYLTGFGSVTNSGGSVSFAAGPSVVGQYNVSIVSGQSRTAPPASIGTPILWQNQAIIRNSQTRRLQIGSQTVRSPQVDFGAFDTNPNSTVPAGSTRVELGINSPLGSGSPPFFFYSNALNPADDPDTPTFWDFLFADIGASNGTFSTSKTFVFDTGAEVSVMSWTTLNALGIFQGTTPQDFQVDVTGFQGTTTAPGFYINSLSLGGLTWTHVPIVALNVPDPSDGVGFTPGILGINLFTDRDLIINALDANPYLQIGPQLTPQWNNATGGNWGEDVKWTLGVPDAPDSPANFLSAISSPQTITVDGTGYTLGSIKFDNTQRYTINGPGRLTLQTTTGPAQINVASGSHTINAPMTFANDTSITITQASSRLTISSDVTATGVAISKGGLGALEMKNVRASSLSINAGSVLITANGTSTGTSRVSSLTIAGGALLDLANNKMVIDYSSVGTLVDDVRQHLLAGRIVASSGDFTHRLGYADNAVLHKGTFGGQTVTDNAVLIGLTLAGDANLDGQVNGADLAALAAHWQSSGGVWTSGDFDYNGKVDINDLYLLAIDWQQSGPSLAATLATLNLPGTDAIPEPAALAAASAIVASVSRRSRRRITKASSL
jgi:hypothetical protein